MVHPTLRITLYTKYNIFNMKNSVVSQKWGHWLMYVHPFPCLASISFYIIIKAKAGHAYYTKQTIRSVTFRHYHSLPLRSHRYLYSYSNLTHFNMAFSRSSGIVTIGKFNVKRVRLVPHQQYKLYSYSNLIRFNMAFSRPSGRICKLTIKRVGLVPQSAIRSYSSSQF